MIEMSAGMLARAAALALMGTGSTPTPSQDLHPTAMFGPGGVLKVEDFDLHSDE